MNSWQEALREVVDILDRLGINYRLGGSAAEHFYDENVKVYELTFYINAREIGVVRAELVKKDAEVKNQDDESTELRWRGQHIILACARDTDLQAAEPMEASAGEGVRGRRFGRNIVRIGTQERPLKSRKTDI